MKKKDLWKTIIIYVLKGYSNITSHKTGTFLKFGKGIKLYALDMADKIWINSSQSYRQY